MFHPANISIHGSRNVHLMICPLANHRDVLALLGIGVHTKGVEIQRTKEDIPFLCIYNLSVPSLRFLTARTHDP